MMDQIQILAFRGSEALRALQLKIDEFAFDIPVNFDIKKQYNVRCVFELVNEEPLYPESILGEVVAKGRCGEKVIGREAKIIFKGDSFFNHEINLPFKGLNYVIEVRLFEDRPVHNYEVLQAVPAPTDMLTLYFTFSTKGFATHPASNIQKHFDGYSHLGFFLADLAEMKEVIFAEYGNKKLDLIEVFSNTELIDRLFEKQVFMIIWGIKPFTYPIYSADDPDILGPLAGEAFEQEGLFRIREDIRELSLVPGHKLRDWPDFLDEDWPEIKLQGRGVKTHLSPCLLMDADAEVVITSFVVFRSEGAIQHSQPLLNIDFEG